jgi:hypothetical protein
VLRGPLRPGGDPQSSERGFHNNPTSQGCFGCVRERSHLPFLNPDAFDADRSQSIAVFPDGGMGNAFDHFDAFGDAAEGRVLSVESRLGMYTNEELGPVGIRLVGNPDGGNGASLVFQVAEFPLQQLQTTRTPLIPGRLGIFQERIAALNDAVNHHAEEGAAVVVALRRTFDELLHMLRGFVRRKFEAEFTQLGGDHRLHGIRTEGGLLSEDATLENYRDEKNQEAHSLRLLSKLGAAFQLDASDVTGARQSPQAFGPGRTS